MIKRKKKKKAAFIASPDNLLLIQKICRISPPPKLSLIEVKLPVSNEEAVGLIPSPNTHFG